MNKLIRITRPLRLIRRAMYVRRTAFQNMRLHHVHLDLAMADVLLERVDMVASSGVFVAEERQDEPC